MLEICQIRQDTYPQENLSRTNGGTMSDLIEPCNECGRTYNKSKLANCPGCARAESDNGGTRSSSHTSGGSRDGRALTDSDLISQIAQGMRYLTISANGTRERVQSLARALWTYVMSSIFAGLFILLAFIFRSYEGTLNLFCLVAAFITVLAGTIGALISLYKASHDG